MPRRTPKQVRESNKKWDRLTLGSPQRLGNVFKMPESTQSNRLQAQIDRELGGK